MHGQHLFPIHGQVKLVSCSHLLRVGYSVKLNVSKHIATGNTNSLSKDILIVSFEINIIHDKRNYETRVSEMQVQTKQGFQTAHFFTGSPSVLSDGIEVKTV